MNDQKLQVPPEMKPFRISAIALVVEIEMLDKESGKVKGKAPVQVPLGIYPADPLYDPLVAWLKQRGLEPQE